MPWIDGSLLFAGAIHCCGYACGVEHNQGWHEARESHAGVAEEILDQSTGVRGLIGRVHGAGCGGFDGVSLQNLGEAAVIAVGLNNVQCAVARAGAVESAEGWPVPLRSCRLKWGVGRLTRVDHCLKDHYSSESWTSAGPPEVARSLLQEMWCGAMKLKRGAKLVVEGK